MIIYTFEIISMNHMEGQKGIRSFIDEDARVGKKSKTQDFYGSKKKTVVFHWSRTVPLTP